MRRRRQARPGQQRLEAAPRRGDVAAQRRVLGQAGAGVELGARGGDAAAGLVRFGVATLHAQHGRQRQPGLRPARLAGAREQLAQARHRGIELVQVLLQRRPHQQHLRRRGRGVGPGSERGEREAGEARIPGLAGAVEVALGDAHRERGVVGPGRELLAQALVLAAVAGGGGQDLDHLVVAGRDDGLGRRRRRTKKKTGRQGAGQQ